MPRVAVDAKELMDAEVADKDAEATVSEAAEMMTTII
jgi:hypothetical protein